MSRVIRISAFGVSDRVRNSLAVQPQKVDRVLKFWIDEVIYI